MYRLLLINRTYLSKRDSSQITEENAGVILRFRESDRSLSRNYIVANIQSHFNFNRLSHNPFSNGSILNDNGDTHSYLLSRYTD